MTITDRLNLGEHTLSSIWSTFGPTNMVPLHLLLPILIAFTQSSSQGKESPLPQLMSTITLPNVRGRIDHMAIDESHGLVFVCALGNNTVEVVNLVTARWLQSIPGFSEPQGILFDAEQNRLFVTNGGDGSCAVLDASNFKTVKTIGGLADADNIRYERTSKTIYVGYGSGGLAAIDPMSLQTKFIVSLPDHPESFQLESNGHFVYVNVPHNQTIILVDRRTKSTLKSWPVREATANYPMALDEKGHRLFIGFRNPPCIQTLDLRSGKSLSSVPIGEDVDDLFFDAKRNRVYASCGGGEIDVFAAGGTRTPVLKGKIQTRKGARTSLLAGELNVLIVVAPAQEDQQAALLVFSLGD